jgi:hypothetical protein
MARLNSAAIIFLLNTLTNLLLINPYVSVFLLVFSKAFDTDRPNLLMKELAELNFLDKFCNWLADFLTWHS